MLACPQCRRTYADGIPRCEADGAELVPESALMSLDQDLSVGDVVGEYRIEELIGRGGFGTVYRAVHPMIGKPAAVKVLSRQYSSNPEMVARFLSEARAVNKIAHKNIVDIFSFGTTSDGRQYYVMELLVGSPLDAYLAEKGALPLAEALPIFKGVARAMDAAHAAGILHRDLKPANVFLSFDGEHDVFPKLLDFGIAKLVGDGHAAGSVRTETGAPMGTPHYMSPEQCRGATVDQRTDVYAFGVMVHEVLTGRLPFVQESTLEIMMLHLTGEPPRISAHAPHLGTALDEAVLRMLEKEPDARPSSLGQALKELAEAAQGAGLPVDSAAFAPVVAPGVTGRNAPVTASSKRLVAISNAATIAQTDPTLVAQSISTKLPGGRGMAFGAGAAGLVVLGALVGGGVWLGRAHSSGAGQVASAASMPVPSPSSLAQGPEPTAAPLAATVSLTVASIPERVDVFIGDANVGSAPGPISVPRGDAPVSLTFKAPGFQPKTIEVMPRADGAVSVTLAPAKAVHKAAAPRRTKEVEF